MGVDQLLFVKGESISETLVCKICTLVLDSPIRLSSCDHYFCQSCIQDWFRTKSTCPTCRRPQTNTDPAQLAVETHALRNILGEEERFCSNKPQGCMWIGPGHSLLSHVTNDCLLTEQKRLQIKIQKITAENQMLQDKNNELSQRLAELQKEANERSFNPHRRTMVSKSSLYHAENNRKIASIHGGRSTNPPYSCNDHRSTCASPDFLNGIDKLRPSSSTTSNPAKRAKYVNSSTIPGATLNTHKRFDEDYNPQKITVVPTEPRPKITVVRDEDPREESRQAPRKLSAWTESLGYVPRLGRERSEPNCDENTIWKLLGMDGTQDIKDACTQKKYGSSGGRSGGSIDTSQQPVPDDGQLKNMSPKTKKNKAPDDVDYWSSNSNSSGF